MQTKVGGVLFLLSLYNSYSGYTHFTERVGKETQVVGDDLLVTNPTRIQTGIDKKACNALLLKVNQIGTLTESIQAAKMSLKEGWGVMVSHRSGKNNCKIDTIFCLQIFLKKVVSFKL